MTTSIDLLRHGETQSGNRYCGRTDSALSENGWEQMWAATAGEAPWEIIFTSPLQRCAAFARALAQTRSLALRVDPRLQELDFGAWESRTAEELWDTQSAALTRFWNDPWRHGPLAGERLDSLRERVVAAWRDIVSLSRPTLVITHGGPIRVLLYTAGQINADELLTAQVAHASRWRLPAQVDMPAVAIIT